NLRTATATIVGDLEDLRVDGRVELGDLLLNERAVEVEPFRVAWSPKAVVVTGLAGRVGSGRVTAPSLAILLDPAAKEWPLAQRVAGVVRVERLPISVARQLVEDSPYYRRPEADQVRETLALWRVPVGGDITATLGVVGGPAPFTTADEAARVLLARTVSPAVEATLRVPNLVSPPGSEQAPTQLTVAATLQGERLELREARLHQEGGALVTLTGYRIRGIDGKPGEVRMTGKAVAVPLRSLSRLPIADLRERLAQFQPLDGLLEFQAEVTGTDQEPHARFSVDVERPVLNGIPFDQFRLASGEYDGAKDQLQVTQAQVTKRLEGEEVATLLLSGSLPLSWPELEIPRTAARRLSVEIPEQSLKVFSRLATDAEEYARSSGGQVSERVRSLVGTFRQVAATEGRMKGEMTLGGTGVQPRNAGGISLTGASLRIDGMQTAIQDFNVRLELAGDLVRVAEFRGKSTQGGEFKGGGTVRLARGINGQPTPSLDLSLAVTGFRVVEKQLGSVLGEAFTGSQFTGTLDTVSQAAAGQSRPLLVRGEWPHPSIEGGVRLDKSTLQLVYEERGTPEEKTVPLDARVNVRLFTGDDVWLRNPQLRLKVDGSLLASNTIREPMIAGDLAVTRGSFLLSGLRLRNAEGVIRVAYDRRSRELGVAPPPPIYVDIAATTSIRVQRAAAEEAEYYDTTFEIRGAPGSGGGDVGLRQAGVASGLAVGSDTGLTLTVRTDPPLPSREIEALIRQQFGVEGFSGSGANVVEALRGQIEQAFAVNVTSALAGRIEDVLQSALGLNTLSLDLGITQPLRVRLGKRLFGPVYGTVTQEFGNVNSQRQFEVYYRITPQLRVGYRQEDPSGRRVLFFSGTKSF
ncbi:MAG: hypothetical protein K0Q72_2139, partial [Armatimonadetes bacterium]|nr:hypothetical protein [Armatimonadota bacterium]